MNKKPIISLRDVGVRYKRTGSLFRKTQYYDALKSVTFDIYQGETLGILGRNGAGKSTLLKVISGVIKPDSGEIINYNSSVSLLALQAGFDQNLTGRDNAILSGMLQGFSRKEVEVKLQEIQEFSELGDFFYEPVFTYSSGMRTRLGFSVSTTLCPDILLIDEVLSVGDKGFRQKAEKKMRDRIDSDQTIVLISHSQAQISRLCDRALIIDKGVSSKAEQTVLTIEKYKKL